MPARRGVGSWLLYSIGVLGLSIALALLVLVRPASEPPSDPPQPDAVYTLAATAATGEAELLPSPTHTPSPTATPLPTATSTPLPSPTPTPTPTPTPPPSPTPVPPPSPTSALLSGSGTITVGSGGTRIIRPPVAYPDAQLAGRTESHTYFSQITGKEEPYRIYLPPDYDQSDRRYPVLYLIHGWPYDEFHWDNLGIDEVADAGIQAGLWPPFLIVMPGADPDGIFVHTAGGDRSIEGQIVNELLPHIDTNYRTWAAREGRAIGGISRGGVWALEIGLRHPDLFAIVGGHSPALKYNLAPQAYDPFYLARSAESTSLRIYLSAGDTDWAFQHTQALHELLDSLGVANQFAVHQGSHSDSLWMANISEYLAFYTAGWSAQP